MYKLGFYVPESHLEPVKTALFEAGAGRTDGYALAAQPFDRFDAG